MGSDVSGRLLIQRQTKLAPAHLEANRAVLVRVEGLKEEVRVHTGICKDNQSPVVTHEERPLNSSDYQRTKYSQDLRMKKIKYNQRRVVSSN